MCWKTNHARDLIEGERRRDRANALGYSYLTTAIQRDVEGLAPVPDWLGKEPRRSKLEDSQRGRQEFPPSRVLRHVPCFAKVSWSISACQENRCLPCWHSRFCATTGFLHPKWLSSRIVYREAQPPLRTSSEQELFCTSSFHFQIKPKALS